MKSLRVRGSIYLIEFFRKHRKCKTHLSEALNLHLSIPPSSRFAWYQRSVPLMSHPKIGAEAIWSNPKIQGFQKCKELIPTNDLEFVTSIF